MNYDAKPPNSHSCRGGNPLRGQLTVEEKIACGVAFLAAVFVFVLVAIVCSGCAGTVAPKLVASTQASFDGNEQNSGIIDETDSHAGIVTPHFRDRYNSLVEVYGGAFNPTLKKDEGITATATNTFVIDAQHFDYFFRMCRWRKQGPPPWASQH